MRRREFIMGAGSAAAWPLVARAQPSNAMRRVGVLLASSASQSEPLSHQRMDIFRRTLQSLGWSDQRNINIDFRFPTGDTQRINADVADLINLKPDAIVVVGSPALTAARNQTRTIPIVFVLVVDPLATGFISNLRRPGENITGFSNVDQEMGGKWLELLKGMAPKTNRVLALNLQGSAGAIETAKLIQSISEKFAVQFSEARARDARDLGDAIDEFGKTPNGGLIVLPSALTTAHREFIIERAARHALPAIYPYKFFATDGGLASYGIDTVEDFRRAATYVDRILRGEKPGDLPVQQPMKFEFVLNLKTAKALGLEIPPTLLALTDEVIE